MRRWCGPDQAQTRPATRDPDEMIEAIVRDMLHSLPEDGSAHSSTRTLADRFGVGKDAGARIWRARDIEPRLVDTF